MSTVKLAHISDLHCDSSSHWTKNFERVRDCLMEELPNIIVITGDCVDHPMDKHFDTLSDALQELCDNIKTKHSNHKLFMLSIPGNHDRNFFGNKLPLLGWRSNTFDKHKARLFFADNQTGVLDWDTLTKMIFEELDIALFPIDSNPRAPARISFAFARGRVEDPYGTFKHFDTQFREIARKSGKPYSSCPKVALLHHHPFPLPATKLDERLEPFNIMVNAHQFLSAAADFDIDIVLHGHRHISGLLEVTLPTVPRVSMHICACASTCSRGEHRHELHMIESRRDGNCVLRTFECDDKNPVFRAKQEKGLIPYGRKRKKRYRDPDVRPVSPDSPIAEIATKTKVVKILPNGTALVRVSLDSIHWMRDTPPSKMCVKFHFGSDIGRIFECWKRLSADRSAGDLRHEPGPSATATDEHPDHRLSREDRTLDVYPTANPPSVDEAAFCTIRYPILNAYALHKTQHEEAYEDWPKGRVLREETCTIRADYPTELLRLIIRFPSEAAFPDPTSIYADVHKDSRICDLGHLPREPNVLRREYYTLHEELFDDRETTFLREVHALNVCPEINVIMLLVRYPQPGSIYTVRWTVPDDPQAEQFTDDEKRNLIALRGAFAEPDHTGIRPFYERLSFLLKKLRGWENLSFYLLGYDQNRKSLRVVHGPDMSLPYWPLRVGRGASGTAFKTLRPEYYEKNRIRRGPAFDHEKGTFYVEPLHKGFTPDALLAIPLVYPELLRPPDSREVYGRSFAVLTIAANDPAPALAQYDPLRSPEEGGLDAHGAQEGIGRLYDILSNALTDHIGDIVPALKSISLPRTG